MLRLFPRERSPSTYAHRSVTGRDLISIQDFSPDELACALELAAAMKARPADFRGILAGKQIVLFFEKPSLRTRLTFEAGINSLGGSVVLRRPDAVAAGRARELERRGA